MNIIEIVLIVLLFVISISALVLAGMSYGKNKGASSTEEDEAAIEQAQATADLANKTANTAQTTALTAQATADTTNTNLNIVQDYLSPIVVEYTEFGVFTNRHVNVNIIGAELILSGTVTLASDFGAFSARGILTTNTIFNSPLTNDATGSISGTVSAPTNIGGTFPNSQNHLTISYSYNNGLLTIFSPPYLPPGTLITSGGQLNFHLVVPIVRPS